MSYFDVETGALMEDLTQEQLEAINPDTPLDRLQTIAQDAPELHPLLALNPSTYPDLLDWLAELQDTQVNDALAKRAELVQRGELEHYAMAYLSPDSPVSEPQVSQPSELPLDLQPETSQPDDLPVPEESQPSPLPESPVFEEPESEPIELEFYEDDYSSAAVAAAEMAAVNRENQASGPDFTPDFATAAGPEFATTGRLGSRFSRSRATTNSRYNRFWLWMIFGLLIWLVVIVLVVWGLANQADKPVPVNANAAEPTPSVSATPQELVQNGLPEGYTGPTKTIEVPGANPGETIKRVVPDESASPSASPTPTPTDPLAAPANAKKLNSFTTADGNVRCIFSGSQVQCFANSTDPYYCSAQAPNTGYSDVLYASHSRRHEYACIEPIDTATEGTLASNETVSNGIFACQASKSGNRVVCWNTTAGDGIVVGSDMAARFGKGQYVPPQWDK